MTIERAIEILNPEHREHYESIEPVNEACRMGMQALKKQMPKKVKGFTGTCECGKTIYPHMKYCNNCGQALNWGDT